MTFSSQTSGKGIFGGEFFQEGKYTPVGKPQYGRSVDGWNSERPEMNRAKALVAEK